MTYQRIALAVGAISASVVLALGMTAAGFAPGPAGAMQSAAGQGDAEPAVAEPASQPRKIYVKPAPKAKTIVVREGAPSRTETASVKTSPAQPKRTAPRTHRKKSASPPAEAPRTPPSEREGEAAKHECERAAERLHETDERAAEELKKQCENR